MLLGELIRLSVDVSNKAAQRLLQTGRVACDGQIIRDKMVNVDPGLHEITLDGLRIGQAYAHHYYVLNKPKGVVTALKDNQFKTVIDCLSPQDQHDGLSFVGRLDRNTTGLIFLTDNGQLHYIMEHARFDKEKTYYVEVNGWVDEKMVECFAAGLELDGGIQLKPAQLKILSQSNQLSRCELILTEGKFHQVKRMFLTCGVKVMQLHRLQMGPLRLDDQTNAGQYRGLYASEAESLKKIMFTSRR